MYLFDTAPISKYSLNILSKGSKLHTFFNIFLQKGTVAMSEFSEYADKIRSSIDNETAIVNNRMNWLLLLQGFLFTGFTQTLNQHKSFSIFMAGVGICVACIMRYSFWQSEKAIQFLLLHWDRFLDEHGKHFSEFPPVWAGSASGYLEHNGKLSKKEMFLRKHFRFLIEHKSLPMLLLCAWIVSLVLCVFA